MSKRDPLDGSTSGTIGGGGPQTGGPTEHPEPLDTPQINPDNAASGRLSPDPLAATVERDELKPGPSDVSNAELPRPQEDVPPSLDGGIHVEWRQPR